MSASWSRSLAILVLALTLLLGFAFAGTVRPSAAAPVYSSISIVVDHPSYGAISSEVPIVVTARGGPAEDFGGNYTLTEITATGTNTTGFDWSPKDPRNDLGIFKVNITMPAKANQTIKLTVNVTSASSNEDKQSYSTTTFEMKVVAPIIIKAQVFNRGSVDASNVTAKIYVDGTLLHSWTFNLTAGASTNLSYNWTFASIRHGKHIVTVTIDEPNDIVEFSEGNNVMTRTIYIGSQGNPAGAVLTMVLIIMSILFVLTYLQKPVRRTKKF